MKQTGIFGVLLLLFLPAMGCVCQPGYYGGNCANPCQPNACGVPWGCGSIIHQGVVDYVNGPPGGGEAECGCGGSCATPCGSVCGSCTSNCGSCLGTLGNGILVLGEGAFSLAASPFILAGHVIRGGPCGYETYANCGCSNEVYYGDNCYQQHDFCDPCAGSCDPCGCGTSVATTGCSRCANGYREGVQYENSPPKQHAQPNAQPMAQPRGPQKMSRPVQSPTPVRNARAVTQTSYQHQQQRQHPVSNAQRIAPPQPQRARPAQPLPPKPQTVGEDAPVLPSDQ